MRKSKALIRTQRKSLDEKLLPFQAVKTILLPGRGWVRAVREALGMTTAQLAQRMGIQQSGVVYLEQREVSKGVTLESLERAARAMNCRLIYAIVPETSLEDIVDQQAERSAKRMLSTTLHSMSLEKQTAGDAETQLHLEELATEIKTKMDRRLWEQK